MNLIQQIYRRKEFALFDALPRPIRDLLQEHAEVMAVEEAHILIARGDSVRSVEERIKSRVAMATQQKEWECT